MKIAGFGKVSYYLVNGALLELSKLNCKKSYQSLKIQHNYIVKIFVSFLLCCTTHYTNNMWIFFTVVQRVQAAAK